LAQFRSATHFSQQLSAPYAGVIFFEGSSIFVRVLISLTAVLLIAGIGFTFFKSQQNVEIISSSFKCFDGNCQYTYQLKNISSTPQSGSVYILLKYGKVRSGYVQDMGYIEKEFNLAGNTEKTLSGVYKSHKKLDAYFRLNSKKI
jgi:hypothetical protein